MTDDDHMRAHRLVECKTFTTQTDDCSEMTRGGDARAVSCKAQQMKLLVALGFQLLTD